MADPAPWRPQAVPTRYRYAWELFCDWCAATHRTALPADPGTVTAFLDAHPATRPTHRRRLSAIRWAHQHARQLAPHRTPQLRSRVLPPSGKTIDVETIRPLLQQIPTSGWTAGLVGRRDALLLVLVARGVPYTAIQRLRRRDITVDGNRCLVLALPTAVVRIPAAPADPRTCPAAVYLRWARLLAYHDRYPSTLALAAALRAAPPISADEVERYHPVPTVPRDGRDPLLPGLDRWGQLAMPRGGHDDRCGITAESAAAIVHRHLAGTAVFRLLDEAAPVAHAEPAANEAAIVAHQTTRSAVAHSEGVARRRAGEGVARRRAASERLADLDATFTAIEQRATELTAWIDCLLDETHYNPRP